MMRILSFEKFAFGCVVIILAVFALGYGLFTGEIEFVTCGILLSFLAAVNIYLASRKPSPAGMVDQYADERDRYVAMKSATATLKVLNILFFTAFLYCRFRSCLPLWFDKGTLISCGRGHTLGRYCCDGRNTHCDESVL